jgi:hypothetical protein
LPLKIVAQEQERKLVTQIQGHNLPFGGGWEFRLMGNGGSTTGNYLFVAAKNHSFYGVGDYL